MKSKQPLTKAWKCDRDQAVKNHNDRMALGCRTWGLWGIAGSGHGKHRKSRLHVSYLYMFTHPCSSGES